MPAKTVLTVVVTLCFCYGTSAQVFRPDSSLGYVAHRHETGEWGGIYCKGMGGTHKIVLQIYNLKYCSMDILLFGIRAMGKFDGLYNANHVNPYFTKIDRDSAYALYRELYDGDVISLTNGVFFEAPTESLHTKLAYPLQVGGILMSSGGSPYGPISGNYPLQVLKISDSLAEVGDYDWENGPTVRNATTFPNQVVTLNYRNHPNVKEFPLLNKGYKSRYHLLTAIDCDNEPGNETVIILTSNYELSIFELAEGMKKLHPSIKDVNILTLDGGGSISITDRDGDDVLESPQCAKVPMYFGFRRRGTRQSNMPMIMNPGKNEVVNPNHRYFIFYFSKDDKNEFELYQDEKLITTLEDIGLQLHKGLLVWDPIRCRPGNNYRVKLRSSSGQEATSECFTVER